MKFDLSFNNSLKPLFMVLLLLLLKDQSLRYHASNEEQSIENRYLSSGIMKKMKIIIKESYSDTSHLALADDIRRLSKQLFKYAGIEIITGDDSSDYVIHLSLSDKRYRDRVGFLLEFFSRDGYFLKFYGANDLETPTKISNEYQPPPPPENQCSNYVYNMKLAEAMSHVIYKVFGSTPLIDALNNTKLEGRSSIVDVLLAKWEPGTTELLITSLDDKDPDVRKAAARALGIIRDTRAVLPLIRALRDDNNDVCIAAANALGQIKDSRALTPLLPLLCRNVEEIGNVLYKIDAWFYSTKAAKKMIPKLLVALNDTNPDIRKNVIRALGILRNNESMSTLFSVFLKDKNTDVQNTAYISLFAIDAQWKCTKMLRRLVPGYLKDIESKDPAKREVAIRALGILKEQSAFNPLVAALHDNISSIRINAVQSLGQLNNLRIVEPLCIALRDQCANVRIEAVKTLEKLKKNNTITPLIPLLNDPDPEVRVSVARALSIVQDTSTLYPLCNALKDESKDVQQWAAISLGMLGDHRAVNFLIAALNDTSAMVRKAIVIALKDINDFRSAKQLGLVLVNDKNYEVRVAAAEALGKLGATDYSQPLIAALKDDDANVRWASVEALSAFREKDALVPLLEITLNDEWLRLRYTAKKALYKICKRWTQNRKIKEKIPLIINSLSSTDKDTRSIAIELLGDLKYPQALEPLLNMFSEDDFEMRRKVENSLNEIDPYWKESIQTQKKSLQLIRESKSKKPELCSRSIRILGVLNDSIALELATNMCKDNDPDVRKAVLHAIYGNNDPRVEDIIMALLNDKDPDVRDYAADALRLHSDTRPIHSKKSYPLIIGLLKSEEQNLREAAIYKLGNIKEPRGVESLTKAVKYNNFNMLNTITRSLANLGAIDTLFVLMNSRDPEIREAVFEGLHELLFSSNLLKKNNYLKPLISTLVDNNHSVREKAANILSYSNPQWMQTIEAKEMIPTLFEPVLHSKNLENRESAIKVLGSIGGFITANQLTPFLQDNYSTVRETAAEALGTTKIQNSIKPLLNMLIDPYYLVVDAAKNALEKINPEWETSYEAKTMVMKYLRALKNKNPGIRCAAAKVLGTVKDSVSVKPLIFLLKDKDPNVRRAAAESLGQLSDLQAVNPLIELLYLGGQDAVIAAGALGVLKDQRAVESLYKSIEHGFPIEEAIRALTSIGGTHAQEIIIHLQKVFLL